jgi:hypothetical protein
VWDLFRYWRGVVGTPEWFQEERGQRPWRELVRHHDRTRVQVGEEFGRTWKPWPLTMATARRFGLP